MIVTIKELDRHVSWGAKDAKGNVKPKYDNCFDKWVPGLDKVTGMLRTGLKNGQDEGKFEKELGLEKGMLKRSSPFWDDFVIIIPEEGLVIDTDSPMGELQYTVLQADPEVATTREQADSIHKTKYLMTSEVAKAKVGNTKRDVIAKAYAKFINLTQDEVIDALYMLGANPGTTDPEICRDSLGDRVDKNPSKFLAVVGDELFEDKVWLIKLIKKGIVEKQGRGAGYDLPLVFGNVLLGKGLDEAVAYIKSKDNQNILVGLKKEEEELA